jgi:hypothetical protein
MFGALWSRGDPLRILLDGSDQVLDRVDLSLFEIRLAALVADPCWYRVENNVTTIAIHVERRRAPRQLASAVNAGHRDLRRLKPSSHSCGSGR